MGATDPGQQTVLLVEDDPNVRYVARVTLVRSGYRAIEAGSGKEAVAAFEAHRDEIEVLLTDLSMPHMTGRELADRLRSQKATLEVVFMSGFSDEVAADQGLIDAGHQLLSKPFTPDSLVTKVRAAFERVQQRR